MKARTLLILALLAGLGCLHRPDKPQLPTTPITGSSEDYLALLNASAEKRFILLGESTHGTLEFIDERRRITEAIASERRILAVVIEADAGETDDAAFILGPTGAWGASRAFRGYPSWPWRSEAFRQALESIRTLSENQPTSEEVILIGIDFHGFDHIIERLVSLTDGTPLSGMVGETKACYKRNVKAYEPGSSSRGPTGPCGSLSAALVAAAEREGDSPDGFRLAHLARTLLAAEQYHVAIGSGMDAWSIRERYMYDTLVAIDDQYKGVEGAIVVWAHNTHVGDARMTSFRPLPSLGQILREFRARESYSVGLVTSRGTVFAARSIGSPAEEMELNPPLRESVEHVLALACEEGNCLVTSGRLGSALDLDRPTRAIGLVYRRSDEIRSHYIHSIAARQFDAIVYLDKTTAVGTMFP